MKAGLLRAILIGCPGFLPSGLGWLTLRPALVDTNDHLKMLVNAMSTRARKAIAQQARKRPDITDHFEVLPDGSYRLSDWFWQEMDEDPEFILQCQESDERHDRSVRVPCAWGWCVYEVDPLDNKMHRGMGPVACPCDHLPGWKSAYIAGQAKPATPVKVTGRHGSRAQRSRRRHQRPSYADFFGWLPARCALRDGDDGSADMGEAAAALRDLALEPPAFTDLPVSPAT